MYNGVLKNKVGESVSELEKIATIKFGQKWSVSTMNTINATPNDRVLRTLWYTSDSRNSTKAYFISVYDNAFALLESIFTNIANYIMPCDFPKSKQFKLIKKLMINITSANTGLHNIKGSYAEDRDFGKWIKSFIKSINSKLADSHYRLQNYLIAGGLINPKVRDNQKLMRAESISLSPRSAPIDITPNSTKPTLEPPLDRKSLKKSIAEPTFMNVMDFEGAPSDDDEDEQDQKIEKFVLDIDNAIDNNDDDDSNELF
jgi:hypothetical protein